MLLLRKHTVAIICFLGISRICHTAQDHLRGNRDWNALDDILATQAAPAASTIGGAGVGTLTEMSIDDLDADGDFGGLVSDDHKALDADTLGGLGHIQAEGPSSPATSQKSISKIIINFNEDVFGDLVRGKKFNKGMIYKSLENIAQRFGGTSTVSAKTLRSKRGTKDVAIHVNLRTFELTFKRPLDAEKYAQIRASVQNLFTNYGFIIKKVKTPTGLKVFVCSNNAQLSAQLADPASVLTQILNAWANKNQSKMPHITHGIRENVTLEGSKYPAAYVFDCSGPSAQQDARLIHLAIERLLQQAKRM